MKNILLTFCLCTRIIFAANCDHLLLSKALVAAEKGEPVSNETIEGTLACLRSQDESVRAFSAVAVSYFPKQSRSIEFSTILNTALGTPDPVSLLGKTETSRLLRLRADHAYEKGQFANAAQDYLALSTITEGFLQEYSIIKLGWSYLNDSKPNQAFELWRSQLAIHSDMQNSQTLYRGLGQAFAEWVAQLRELPATNLIELKLSKENQTAFIEGLLEGSDAFISSANLSVLSHSVENLPWYREFITKLISRDVDSLTGFQACERLSLIVPILSQVDLSYDPYGKVGIRCIRYHFQDSQRSQGPSQEALENVIPKLQLKAKERYWRARYYQSVGKPKEACEQLVLWMDETPENKNRESIAATELVNSCTEMIESAAENEIDTFSAALLKNASIPYFSNQKDPLVYLIVKLFEKQPFLISFQKRVSEISSQLKDTLIPSLLLEAAVKQGNDSLQMRSVELFGTDHLKTQQTNKLWDAAYQKTIRTQLETQTLESARQSLDSHYPLSQIATYTETIQGLWLTYFVAAKTQSPNQSCPSEVDTFIRAQGKYKTLLSDSLRLGLNCGRVQTVAEVFSRTEKDIPKPLSDTIERIVFEIALQNPEAFSNVPEIHKSKRIQSTLTLAKSLSDGTAIELPVATNSLYSNDAKFLIATKKEADRLLNTKGASRDPVGRIQLWVNYVKKTLTAINRHSWHADELQRSGRNALSRFCLSAGQLAASPEMQPKNINMTSEEWLKVISAIQEQFRVCANESNVEVVR